MRGEIPGDTLAGMDVIVFHDKTYRQAQCRVEACGWKGPERRGLGRDRLAYGEAARHAEDHGKTSTAAALRRRIVEAPAEQGRDLFGQPNTAG